MRRLFYLSPLVILLQAASPLLAAPPNWPAGIEPPPPFAPDRVLVGFYAGTPGAEKSAAHRQAGGAVLKSLDAINVHVVQVPSGTVEQKIGVYEHNPNVQFAEPDYYRYLYLPITNEGSEPSLGIANNFTEQWGLDNTGQAFGVEVDQLTGIATPGAYWGIAGADISAPEGWALVGGAANAGMGTKIAIIDSGVDCVHPDLVGKCVEQLKFVADPSVGVDDQIAHGTHVAAIAAAHSDNGIGTAGVAGGAMLGSLKVCYLQDYLFYQVGVCEDAAIAEAILYAACLDSGQGAGCVPYNVINMSLAGPENAMAIHAAVDNAWDRGVLIVAGAGNTYTQELQYPAAYNNVIAVAATDYYDNLAYFSTFGNTWASVAAPGHIIMSAVPNALCGDPPEGCYDWKSGTSMATPMVAGAAAVVWAQQGAGATNASVRSAIESNADVTGALGQDMSAWVLHGRLNLAGALSGTAPPPSPPSPDNVHVGDLDGTSSSQGGTWTATVTITVHDATHGGIGGAMVSGRWNDNSAAGCTTDGGTCTVIRSNIRKRDGSVTFSIDDIMAFDLSYAASENHDPDGDSNGTEITVLKP